MDRKPIERRDSGCRDPSTVTCRAKFTSVVFEAYTIEARCTLSMSFVLADIDPGRARQYTALACELAELAGRFGHADDELITQTPVLAAAAAKGATLYRTAEFGAHGDNLILCVEVRRRGQEFRTVMVERRLSTAAAEQRLEISAVDQAAFGNLKEASEHANAVRQQYLQREEAEAIAAQQARQGRQVVTMYAAYPGVVAAHETPPNVLHSGCGQVAGDARQVLVPTGGRRAA